MPDTKPFSDAVSRYLDEARIPLRLGVTTDKGWPLVVSLWYIHRDGYLYCATQSGARVVRYLENDNRCGFEVASDEPPYCGVRGLARVKLQHSQGLEILRLLLNRYLGDIENPLAARLLARGDSEVALRLEPVRWTTWNFRSRMEESIANGAAKPCPPARA